MNFKFWNDFRFTEKLPRYYGVAVYPSSSFPQCSYLMSPWDICQNEEFNIGTWLLTELSTCFQMPPVFPLTFYFHFKAQTRILHSIYTTFFTTKKKKKHVKNVLFSVGICEHACPVCGRGHLPGIAVHGHARSMHLYLSPSEAQ